MTQSTAWCAFIFGLVSRRLADVSVLEDIAFLHMNARVSPILPD